MNLNGLRPWGGLARDASPEPAHVVVAGIPYDGSAVYRKGASIAPRTIRQLSAVMPPVTEDGHLMTGLRVTDIGDVDLGREIETGWMTVAERLAEVPPESFLTVLGGDHCTAISTLSAQMRRHPGFHVLWIDAHPDLCDFSRGGRWTCGCALRRALEASGIEPARVVIAGGRDFDPEELEFIRANDILLVTAAELARDPQGSARKIAARLAGKKVHISFDIDALDPAFAPATEIPSAGGLSTRQALDLLASATDGAQLIGLDVVEVSPPLDEEDITTLAALKVIFETWGAPVESADVVIAGGGIMGCALAYQLARRGVDVLLLERETLGSQSTGRCAGGVRQQFSMEANVRLQRMSVQMLKGFEEETGDPADFRQIGYLFVLTLPQQVEDFRRNMEMWHRVGLTEARWVDAEEASRMVPVLNTDDVLGCTFCPTDGIASPADVTSGYVAAARRLGARLREGVEVSGIDVAGGRVQGVRTSAGDVATRLAFDCAGAWSPSIGRMAGLEIPVLPYRRHIAVTGTFPSLPRDNPMTVDFQTSLYFHPEGDGVLIGMSDRAEGPGYATDVNWEFLEKMFEQAARRAPALASAGIKTAWAGLYESTPDHQAILGPVPEVEGFWCAAGFSGHGFMQAPAAALLLTQMLLEGRSEIDISPFAFTRFARGSLVREKNVI